MISETTNSYSKASYNFQLSKMQESIRVAPINLRFFFFILYVANIITLVRSEKMNQPTDDIGGLKSVTWAPISFLVPCGLQQWTGRKSDKELENTKHRSKSSNHSQSQHIRNYLKFCEIWRVPQYSIQIAYSNFIEYRNNSFFCSNNLPSRNVTYIHTDDKMLQI